MTRIPFPLASKPAPFAFMGEPRLVNCYAEAIGPDKQSPVGFLSIPGQTEFSAVTDVPSRGMFLISEDDRVYSLHLSTLYSIDSGGTATAITNAVPGVLPVITARNDASTIQTVIVSDAASYILSSSTISRVVLPEEANSVAFLNGRQVYGCDSGRYYWSSINDGATVDALSYATAERAPDGIVRVFTDHGELWLFGETSTEIHVPTGDADAPFAPLGGAAIDKGCAAKHSVVSFDNAPHWVGSDDTVYRGSQYTATRVSDHGVERAIAALTDKTTIAGYVQYTKGHAFYVLTCPSWTWVLDQATGLWHERKTRLHDDWAAWPYVSAWGKHLVGDKYGGSVRELDDAVYGEDGTEIRAELTLPDISAYPRRLIVDRLDILLGTGVGLNVASTANGYDPQAMLSWSDDGGHTWSSERTVSLGRQGQWLPGVTFRNLGMTGPAGRRFRIAVSDLVSKSFMLGDIGARATVR